MVRCMLLLLLCAFLYTCAANDVVYDEAFGSGFQDWGWGTKNSADTAKAHAGSKSYSFQPAAYNAAYFYKQGGISTSTYSGITFWVYRTATTGPVNFNLVTYSSGTGQSTKTGPDATVASYTTTNWPVNTWTLASVSFGSFPAGTYDGFWLQDQSGSSASYTVYIDDVTLLTKATSTSTTKSATTSTTKAATTTTTTSTTKAGTTSATTSTTKAGTTSTTKAGTTATTGATTSTTKSATTGSVSTTGSTSGSSIDPTKGDASVQSFYKTPTTGGLATYYGAYTNGGACMLDPTPTAGQTGSGVTNTVAIMTTQYMASKTCGMCLSVTYVPDSRDSGAAASKPTGTRTVFVNNECPSCLNDGLDLGLDGDGQWGIKYVAVPCPVGSTTIQYLFKEGSSAYWLGLQPRNTRYPVYTLEAQSGGTWVSFPRMDYNYFVQSFSSGLTFPATIRLTAITGEIITDTISSVQNGVTVISTKQFQVVTM